MEEKITPENYREIREKAGEFYKNVEPIWCPALGDHIVFNSLGFKHIVRHGRLSRPKKEQMRRFALLPHAADIIASHNGDLEYRTEKQLSKVKLLTGKVKKESEAQFWGFTKKINGMSVKVVVRQVGNGKKHFFSIF